MRATRKKHASSTWRAVLAGREALQQGLIKRIVNGESADIWRDRWIVDHFEGRPITPGEGQVVQQVVELLNASGAWNEALIRELFVPVDARAILRMPRARGNHDFWAWGPEKCGLYTVKSAYKLLYKQRRNGNQPQSPSSSGDGVWRRIWKLKVPPKVRVFWWRVMHEFLPARHILWRRHIEPTDILSQLLSVKCADHMRSLLSMFW